MCVSAGVSMCVGHLRLGRMDDVGRTGSTSGGGL